MSGTQLHFWISVLILGLLLFFPVSRMIWVFSVRRLQSKLGKELSEQEISGQLVRARLIAIVVVLIFSYFFNASVIRSLYE